MVFLPLAANIMYAKQIIKTMSTTIDLITDDKMKEELKAAEFIRIDYVVFVRKDHALFILNLAINDRVDVESRMETQK